MPFVDTTGYVVLELKATTWCGGRRILLKWTNPAAALHVKILRRTRSWPYDLTDTADTVYDGVAITEFLDGGADLSVEGTLAGQTYYYYLVLVSASANPTTYDISAASRAMALSIDVYDSKAVLWANTPAEAARLDTLPRSEGGGDGFLDKLYTLAGCWLSRMRGEMNAIRLMADPDKAPYHVLAAQNVAMGVTPPEGESFDYSIPRRTALSLAFVRQRRGTCPGIVEATRMFTLWDATCAEVGLKDGCQAGASCLSTWDGTSQLQRVSGATLTITALDADGRCRIASTGVSWDVDIWADGKLIGPHGDTVCIESSAAGYVTTKPPTRVSSVSNISAWQLTVSSITGLRADMNVQLTGVAAGNPWAGIFAVASMTRTTVTLKATTGGPSSIPIGLTGAFLSIGKSTVRSATPATFTVMNGAHTFLYNDTYDNTMRGTRFDPFNRLWRGGGTSRRNSWGMRDLIIYITSPVVVTSGIPTSITGATLAVDASVPALVNNELVGMYLNPNQNQTSMLEIVSNTTNSITVSGDIGGLYNVDSYYYVLSARDRNRFVRLLSRLKAQFTHLDTDPHVLFI